MDISDDKLREWAKEYCTHSFIDRDPVKFPHKYARSKVDAEISGLLTALISFGRREQILKKALELDAMFKGSPRRWILDGIFFDDIPYNDEIFYRTITNKKMVNWCVSIKIMIMRCGTIENYLADRCSSEDRVQEKLSSIMGFNPKSANKRIAMFLRWMVNDKGDVDLGLWKARKWQKIPIPLDTHVHRMAMELGITKRKTANLKTAREITEYFEKVFPGSPLLGDFALFGYGVNHPQKRK